MTVSQAISIYILKKQEYGRDYRKVAQVLHSFARSFGSLELSDLEARHVRLFLDKRRNLPATWYHKYMRLRGLFRYWAAQGELKRLPLPRKRAARPTEFYPHIFSRHQIRRLLCKVPITVCAPWCAIQAQTMENLLLFLYGTGLNVGEALRVKQEDIDMDSLTIKIPGISGRADRIVPIGTDIKRLVIRQIRISQASPMLFCAKSGKRLSHRTASITFRRLCTIAEVCRQKDSVYQPRLCDLRHTFAVHRIVFWYRRNVSIQEKLPLLAAYMGMVTVTAMEKYLLLTPSKYAKQLKQIG